MDGELVVLRSLHVLPGVLWVGGSLLMAGVVEPRLRAAGPAVQGPAMRAIGKRLSLVLTISGGVSILLGFALVSRTEGREFGDLFTTSWGWAIGLGMVASLIGAGLGSSAGRLMRKMDVVSAQVQGQPTPAQQAEMARLLAGLHRGSLISALMGAVTVVLMVSARYF